MADHGRVIEGCRFIGEYVDEAEVPTDLTIHAGEAVPSNLVAEYTDLGSTNAGLKEFTVLLNDGRKVLVRGQGLKQLPGISQDDRGSFGIVLRSEGEEVLVALFKADETVGIFHGEIQSDRKTA